MKIAVYKENTEKSSECKESSISNLFVLLATCNVDGGGRRVKVSLQHFSEQTFTESKSGFEKENTGRRINCLLRKFLFIQSRFFVPVYMYLPQLLKQTKT